MKKIFKNYWLEFKKEINVMFDEFFNKETNKKQRANMWTFTRLVTSFFIPICSLISILTVSTPLFIGSIVITGFGALTDFFDGRSARKYNSYSDFGKKLDQTADKIFSFMIGLNLSLFNPLFIVNILGEILIAGINAIYKLKNNKINIKSTQIGRIKQWPLFASLILGFISVLVPSLTPFTNKTIILTSLFQLVTTASYIKNNNKLIKELHKKEIYNNNLNEIDLDIALDKEKTLSIEKKSSLENQKEIKNKSKYKDQLIEIRNYLNNNYLNESDELKDGYSKIKQKND